MERQKTEELKKKLQGKINAEKHRTYKAALRWKQQVARGQTQNEQEDFVYLINVPEENNADCTNLLDDMDYIRKGIHMKYGSRSHDLNDIFSYFPDVHQGNNEGGNEQVTLGITNQLKDRRQYNLILHMVKLMRR